MNIVAALAPDFALILLGVAIARLLDRSVWQGLDRLSYYVLYPALIFHAAAARPVALADAAVIGAAAASILSAGFVLGLWTRRLRHSSDVDFGGTLQNAFRFNTALAFVAVGVLPPEATSVLAIVVGCAIPLANVYSVIGLTRGSNTSIVRVARELITNPFLLAALSGLAVALSGLMLPAAVTAFSGRLSDAALPLVLITIGAALAGARLWPLDRQALAIHAIRLLLLPAGVLTVALIMRLRSVEIATLLLFAAMPTATAAHVLAARYGADRSAVALVVTQSSLLGLLTLPIWAGVAVRLLD